MKGLPRLLCALSLTCLALSPWTSPPAHAGLSTQDDSPAGGSGSGSGLVSASGPVVSVEVSGAVELLGASSGPGGGSVSVQAAPVCWWHPGRSGAETASLIKAGTYDNMLADGTQRSETDAFYPGWKDHQDDTSGRWWHPTCSRTRWEGDDEGYKKHAKDFGDGGPRRFLPQDQAPPPPTITPTELATAVRRSLRLPEPQIDTNPTIGPSKATLVGIPTWVWATATTLRQAQITATAATTTVTVSITATGLDLQAPDSRPACHGWGQPWTPGTPEGQSDCTIEFTRSSAHLGGTTPLKASTTYDITWTANNHTTGTLTPITTTTTLNLPVAEVQTINKPPTNKPKHPGKPGETH